MKTLKEDTLRYGASASMTWIHFTAEESCVPRYAYVIQADATSSSSLRLLLFPEEYMKAPLQHKPGNWAENNLQGTCHRHRRWKQDAIENSVGEDIRHLRRNFRRRTIKNCSNFRYNL